ncbi:MAG: molybdopterin cofactor-binding domain-containing protein [Ottowia sp.]
MTCRNYYSEFKSVFTNKPIVTPYRGAGRQHGVFVMERLLDLAAQSWASTASRFASAT